MNILIYGIGGKMGKVLLSVAKKNTEIDVICGVDMFAKPADFCVPVFKSIRDANHLKFDCVIDFSVHEAVLDILPFAVDNNIPCVISTTGHDENELRLIEEASTMIPIFKTGNMSLGINILSRLVKETALALVDNADIEILEAHHNQKLDSPSGTAKMLFESAKAGREQALPVFGRGCSHKKRSKDEIGIHAIRGGSVVGKHSVMFLLNGETVTLSHEAESKDIFAIGSLNAAKFLLTKLSNPRIYDMNDLLSQAISN
ncbi:MAG: 4-hydroxy-tetrahydrodipicolinate reductase [Christensenellaceae bacterium]|jgi:4-hydroxy-tetrahydrodipicolinate reductase|nr:4-hydroxy-tetrahydrodipicolinate reductase [Christensenellaceae bacterium]